MLTPDLFLAADLRRRHRLLDQAVDIVRAIAREHPGPETRSGFAGPVRIAYDREARRIDALLTDAEGALTGAMRQLGSLAHDAEKAAHP